MAADDPSGARSGPIVLRIKLRYDTVEAMVERFAPNVGKSGLFLPTKAIQPIGTQVKFELRILDDTPVLVGMGRVVAAREPDPERPKAPFGIAIELMRVSREGGEMIKRMLGARRALGLPAVGIPMPEDLDAVPRGGDSLSGPVVMSGPVSAPVSAPVMTAPIAQSGPIVAAAAPLAPEPPRPKRPRLAELIAQAQSGPVAMPALPELDAEVDVARALARARVLAGGDVDAELEALREQVSVPTEISIEAASAELARQLGGAAVRKKDRGVVPGWAPPPAVQEAPPPIAPDAAVTAVGEPDPEPEPEKPDVYAAAEVELTTDPSLPVVPRSVLLEEEPETEPEEHEDEQHLDASDIEPLDEQEHTQIGDLPVDPAAFQHHSYATVPQAPADLEERLDQHLAEAEEDVERELEEMQHTAFGASPFVALEPEPEPEREYDVEPVDPAELEAAASAEAAAVDIEEIDDIDVIDESELELEEDPVAEPPPPVEAPQFELPDDSAFAPDYAAQPYDPNASSDFAARLDLGDSAEFDRDAAREFDEAMPARQRSASRSDADLEVALEALDVDLDDLSIPRRGFDPGSGRVVAPASKSGSGRISQLVAKSGSGPVQAPRSPTPAPAPARGKPRLPTDDGVLIDFDDDDE